MAKFRKRSSAHNSHHLATWERFNIPQLMVSNEKADEINIFGPIVSEETAEFWQWWFETDYYTSDVDMQEILAQTTAQEIKLIVNSPGGDVWAGNAIRSFIQSAIAEGRTFTAHVVGVAASAAAYITVAAPKVIMADMAQFMIHRAAVGYDAWGFGNEDELQLAINDLESRKQSLREINKSQVKVFMERMNKSREETQELLRKETWFNAESALESGLATEIQSSGVTVADLKPKPLPQGFNFTPHGGVAHERPAYSFAAAIGARCTTEETEEGQEGQEGQQNKKKQARQPQPPAPPAPPPTTKGVSSMLEQRIRAALGLTADVEITVAHCYQYIERVEKENVDLKAEKKKIEQKAVASTIKTFFDEQVKRGAMTPIQAVSVQTQILAAADPEGMFELNKPLYEGLPNGDDDGATARKSKGTGKAPEGSEEVETAEEETKRLAYKFHFAYRKVVKETEDVVEAQEKVTEELGQEAADAYMHFDFKGDDSPLTEEEVQ